MKQAAQSSTDKHGQQVRQQEKTKRADSRQQSEERKTSLSQLVAATEMFSEGKTGKHTAEAASYFGNQTMLGLLENGRSMKDSIASAAEILSGEAPPVFRDNLPSVELEAESTFEPGTVPIFSSNIPAADIQTVGNAGFI